ncbi:hypothetical protein PUMCH_001364 [Australozyma saopauloensis]|uniref:Palmitoyltransferase n=1 Tax=Australozyma saopauloensis TaxID=291208 RepID=A0AAX4H6M4_9ASCO|nr:hypothetical protein PUMCH_001364 [[Candida] saopauloensis]
MIVLILILALALIIATVLFGNLPSFRHTWIHRLYVQIMNINGIAVRFMTTNQSVYTFLKWLVPAFYVAIVGFCLHQFFVHVYPQLVKNEIVGTLHGICIIVTVAAVVVSTELAVFSDPGQLNARNLDQSLRRYPNDGLIFFGRHCSTCQLEKPARLKHCSTCDRCILRFDHHCIWLNNCVGQNNYRWFLLYLVANVTMMGYGAYLCWRLLGMQKAPRGLWKLIVALQYYNKIAGILMILGVIFSLITGAFAGLHLRYIYLGVTTNEADKWGEVEYLIDLGLLYYVQDMDVYVEKASVSTNGTIQEVYISLDDEHVVIDADDRQHILKQINLIEVLTNIYDKGFWDNLRERIFD